MNDKMNRKELIDELDSEGFIILNDIYSDDEVEEIVRLINETPVQNDTFRKSNDLFAIRQFIKEIPQVSKLIFNPKLKNIITKLFGDSFFVTKSIYFDKPARSNWFVAYHQDLTISVNKKVEIDGYGPWTVKQNQFAVQPPVSVLQNNFTIRIHLDDTDEKNGALKVLRGSNQKGIHRVEHIDWDAETEATCAVKKGGLMLMRPLLMHSSGRTVDARSRRVIHIEFSNAELPAEISWSEKYDLINETH